jgi:hypothetical protein
LSLLSAAIFAAIQNKGSFNPGGKREMRFSRLIRCSAILLIFTLLSHNAAFASKKKPADPAVLKAKIQARGVGQGVRVTLNDATEIKGMIFSIGDQSFAIKPGKKNAQPQEIAYAQLTAVDKDRLSRGERVTTTVIIVLAGIGVAAAVTAISFDRSFKSNTNY